MVLDITAGNVLYAKDYMDITEKVIARLNSGQASDNNEDTPQTSNPDKK
jgi:hypothetical protein